MNKLLIITQKVDENDQLLGFFIDWIKFFSGHFQKVLVVCLEKGRHDLPGNVKIVSLGKGRSLPKYIQLFNFYRLIWRYRNDYDAVFVHMNPIWMALGGRLWRYWGKRTAFWYTSKGVTNKLRQAERWSNIIFTASRESFRLPSRKVIITGHGIDTDFFKPTINRQPSTGLKILSVGRIAPVKNYETLIDAAQILADRGLKFSVTLIGEPALPEDIAYAQKLKDRINRLDLGQYFKFLGKINYARLPEYYQQHDLFVHLSKTGSLDKTLLEAMACGMKVLSSNDAAKSFLPKGLIFSSNDPEDLSLKILRPDKADFDARQYVLDNHDLKKLIDKITAII